ncbi:monooxygenase 2-like isoform X2 [Tripterygium wilfordii]|uniref:monooxygenase 2-like isoform X2 n=1 Tax=Tripterygium wilfordii TaxID=458696 RepID=UPI0018F845EB|nr:monooxygenase 2-like isoform X2 [Tripterygium wilfordii]
MEAVEDVVIVGAGISGLATAVALKRVGIRALVLERFKELRVTGAALTLFPNALLALDALGVSQKLTSLYEPCLNGSMTNVVTGDVQDITFRRTNRNLTEPRAVHRRALLEALAEELPVDTTRFSCKLTAIETQSNPNSPITTIHMEDGTTIKTKILIGCDGVNSVVANWLGLAKTANSGRSSVRGLALYPQGHGLKHEMHQFLDEGKRGGFIPLNDKELYWFLVFQSPPNENVVGKPELIQSEVTENYAKNFPPTFLDIVKHSDLSNLTMTPLGFRYPWDIVFGILSNGNVTVAGDAMHPMTPDLGQGGCSALEDAVLLGRYIGESFIKNQTLVSKDIAQAIQGYVDERRWRVACLVGGSYISGWSQQGGSGWLKKLIRDFAYKFLLIRIVKLAYYDCGRLPSVSSNGELENTSKMD